MLYFFIFLFQNNCLRNQKRTIDLGDLTVQFKGSANFIWSTVSPKPIVMSSSVLLLGSQKFPPKTLCQHEKITNSFRLPQDSFLKYNVCICTFVLHLHFALIRIPCWIHDSLLPAIYSFHQTSLSFKACAALDGACLGATMCEPSAWNLNIS